MTAKIFPSVEEPITVGFIRATKQMGRGDLDTIEFLYNGGWLTVTVSQRDFYGKPTVIKIAGTDNKHYRVHARRQFRSSISANLWHDLKKLADPDYSHPFTTGMGAADVEHPFHAPGGKHIRIT